MKQLFPILFLLVLTNCNNSTKQTNQQTTFSDTVKINVSFVECIDRTDLIKSDTATNLGKLDTLLLEYENVRFDWRVWLDSKKFEFFNQHCEKCDIEYPRFADSSAYSLEPAANDLNLIDEALWSENKFLFIGKREKQKKILSKTYDSTSQDKINVFVFKYYYYKVIKPYLFLGYKTKSITYEGDTVEVGHNITRN